MIITCPECSASFNLRTGALGSEGRKVQCSNCRHVWHAHEDEPDDFADDGGADDVFSGDADEGSGSGEDDFAALMGAMDDRESAQAVPEPEPEEVLKSVLNDDADRSKIVADDIPDAVKPDKAETSFKPIRTPGPPVSMQAMLAGYGAAGAVFAVLLGLFILLQGPIVSAWPPAQAAYALIGRSSVIAGEGLIFDRMEAYEDGNSLVVSGNIINMTKEGRGVPMLEVALRSQYDEPMGRWYIEPPKRYMEAEETMAFEGRLERGAPDGVRGRSGEVNVRFVLSVRTDAEDGGNTHAPAAGDPSHPSGGEAPSGSPQHASSPPHPGSSPESHDGGHSPPDPHHTGGPGGHTSGHD